MSSQAEPGQCPAAQPAPEASLRPTQTFTTSQDTTFLMNDDALVTDFSVHRKSNGRRTTRIQHKMAGKDVQGKILKGDF